MHTVHSPYVSHDAVFSCGQVSSTVPRSPGQPSDCSASPVSRTAHSITPQVQLCALAAEQRAPGFCCRHPGGVISHPFDFSRTPRAKIFLVILNPYASSRDALCSPSVMGPRHTAVNTDTRCVVHVLFCWTAVVTTSLRTCDVVRQACHQDRRDLVSHSVMPAGLKVAAQLTSLDGFK